MRAAHLIAAPALLAAGPVMATGGFECRTTDGSNIRVSAVIGHGIGNPLVGATLHLGNDAHSTFDQDPQIGVAQSWVDSREFRLDLIDVPATRYVAQLRARIMTLLAATGTLRRDGRIHPIRCELE